MVSSKMQETTSPVEPNASIPQDCHYKLNLCTQQNTNTKQCHEDDPHNADATLQPREPTHFTSNKECTFVPLNVPQNTETHFNGIAEPMPQQNYDQTIT